MNPGWPATLREGPVVLRPLRLRDAAEWRVVRQRNVDWLRQWEATVPVVDREIPSSYAAMVRRLRAEAREGRTLPWALVVDGRLAGQVTVGGISRGSLMSGYIGYWIDREAAGRGHMPTAVALAADHCFTGVGLHRIEINVRPENAASLRVVEKLRFRPEGLRERYLHINGQWCDHLTFALCAEDVPHGLLARWRHERDTRSVAGSGP